MSLKFKHRNAVVLLIDELMIKTVDIIKALRLKAAPISYSVMAAVTRGVVLTCDRNLLCREWWTSVFLR